MNTTMGIDQYGQTFHDLGKFPRKVLLERLGLQHASKMYRDVKTAEGFEAKHVGYVIGSHWITLYTVNEWSK